MHGRGRPATGRTAAVRPGRTALDWERDGRDWPHREASRFVDSGGLRWHVQRMGQGPCLLLVHGTGSATHTWRDVAPRLATRFSVLAPDLPGHGFTAGARDADLSVSGMAAALAGLLATLDAVPVVAVGHSAGAAVLVRMALDDMIRPRILVSLNGALLPFDGLAGRLFSPLARVLAGQPWVPGLFARRARDVRSVRRLLGSTGSVPDARSVELYARLMSHPAHVAGVLRMMAQWDLSSTAADLPRLKVPLALVVGGNDRTVPPAEAVRVQRRVPGVLRVNLRGLGHLAHEEAGDEVAEEILRLATAAGA